MCICVFESSRKVSAFYTGRYNFESRLDFDEHKKFFKGYVLFVSGIFLLNMHLYRNIRCYNTCYTSTALKINKRIE